MVINLDSGWSAAFDPDNSGRGAGWWQGPRPEARPMRVPWPLQAEFPGQHGVAWYWREVQAPCHPQRDGRWLLRFWAVDYLAEVWVNDQFIGGHEGGETPFVLDATEAWQPGHPNRIAVRVVNPVNEPIDGLVLGQTPHRNKTVPHRTGGSYNYGGLLESVELLLVPPVRVDDLFARPLVETSVIQVQVWLQNASAGVAGGALVVTVAPAAGGETLAETRQEVQLVPGRTCLTEPVPIRGMRLWNLDDPYLYRVTARWEAAPPGRHDERSVRCGCRDFRVTEGYFRLNGRRLLVRSTHTGNHSPGGQVVAPPSAPDLLRRDLLYAKSCGYNMVRFIAGVGHPYQLDLCDEIGLMVYEESLAGWCLEDSPQMAHRFDFSTREMVQRDRNHPSVVIWGLLNETGDGPVFRHAWCSWAAAAGMGSGTWDR
jgi:beta-galactosidase/beta-glucuronidase